ncbi:MAG: hypothetical protein ACRC8S_10645 [Fimbriiglobus sp.]
MVILFAVYGFIALAYAWLMGLSLYAVGYVWLASTIIKSWLIIKMIKDCHCRNPFLAAFCCLVIGVLFFFGTYHLDQCLRWNVSWLDVERIPGYITFRAESDGWWGWMQMPIVDVMPANPMIIPHLRPKLGFSYHWIAVYTEFLVALAPAVIAWQVASRPYSERLKKWFTKETKILTPDSAKELRTALIEGDICHWAKYEAETGMPNVDHAELTIMYCTPTLGVEELEPEVYLTLNDGPTELLGIEEVAAMTLVFPKIQEWCAAPVKEETKESIESPQPDNSNEYAIETKIPGKHTGRCAGFGLYFWTGLLAIGVLNSPIVTLLGGLYLIMQWQILTHGNADQFTDTSKYLSFFLVAVTLVHAGYIFRHPTVVMSRVIVCFYYSRMIQQTRIRNDALFPIDPEDTVYIEHHPKNSWYKLIAPEPFLVKFDTENEILLMEGDRHRWQIPFAAMKDVQYTATHSDGYVQLVILSVETSRGIVELPLRAMHGLEGDNHFEQTVDLYHLFAEIICKEPAHRRPYEVRFPSIRTWEAS